MAGIILAVDDDTRILLNLPDGVEMRPAPGNRCAWLVFVDGLIAARRYLAYAQYAHPRWPEHRWSAESPGQSRCLRTPGGALRALVRDTRAERAAQEAQA